MNSLRIIHSFFLIPLLTFAFSSNAQKGIESDFLVLNSNDTLYGQVQHIKEGGFGGREFYSSIRIVDKDGKKRKFKRSKVSSFKKDNVVYESFLLSQNSRQFPMKIQLINPRYEIDKRSGEQHFLRLITKDKLSHYKLEWFEQGDDLLCAMSILKKENENFFVRADQGLLGIKKKTLVEYFDDCSNLQNAISQNQLKCVQQIVSNYNNNCLIRETE